MTMREKTTRKNQTLKDFYGSLLDINEPLAKRLIEGKKKKEIRARFQDQELNQCLYQFDVR